MAFQCQNLAHGLQLTDENEFYPSSLIGHLEGKTCLNSSTDHTFGMVLKGEIELDLPSRGRFRLGTGMYFSVPGKFSLEGNGRSVLFSRHGYRGLFFLGGPAEETGRLCYIDNASTTLIGPPPRNGDPCLNLLVFPENIRQSSHIHPTVRLGAVLKGSGECILDKSKRIELRPGMVFRIDAGQVHNFCSGSEGLTVIAYHPDSEGGPTDENHPMLKRTYLK